MHRDITYKQKQVQLVEMFGSKKKRFLSLLFLLLNDLSHIFPNFSDFVYYSRLEQRQKLSHDISSLSRSDVKGAEEMDELLESIVNTLFFPPIH